MTFSTKRKKKSSSVNNLFGGIFFSLTCQLHSSKIFASSTHSAVTFIRRCRIRGENFAATPNPFFASVEQFFYSSGIQNFSFSCSTNCLTFYFRQLYINLILNNCLVLSFSNFSSPAMTYLHTFIFVSCASDFPYRHGFFTSMISK